MGEKEYITKKEAKLIAKAIPKIIDAFNGGSL